MDNLKNNFISLIQEHIVKDKKIKNKIMEALDISYEGLYRRLRGDINFTFEEVVRIALELGFSIDNIIGNQKQNTAQFKLHFLKKDNIQEIIKERIEQNIIKFQDIENSNLSKIKIATNSLPLAIYNHYEYLFKFLLYKWTYQTQNTSLDFSFTDFIMSKKMIEDIKQHAYSVSQKSHLTFIFDEDIYKSIVLELEFFYKRNLIDTETLSLLCNEILNSIDMLENYSITGARQGGGKIDIFISSLVIDRAYVYVETDESESSEFLIYAVHKLCTNNQFVAKVQNHWIESYKKFSTFITQCNEVYRYNFYKTQREYIQELMNKYD